MHIPVLLREAITLLDPKPGEFFIDGTLGGGGHAAAIVEKLAPGGTLLAVDWDRDAIARFERQASTGKRQVRIITTSGNFADLSSILSREGLGKADGLLLDLGFSSDQLEGKGFSFLRDEPLIMTYSEEATPVRELLRTFSEDELRTVIRKYGEERFAGRIARAIKARSRVQPIETTGELVKVIERAVRGHYERRLDPATRTFQALRICANRELENLERVLRALPEILAPGGRVAVITFHSLEDRIVKQALKEGEAAGVLTRLTKKPATPTAAEVAANPRARSAKLRAAQLTYNRQPTTNNKMLKQS